MTDGIATTVPVPDAWSVDGTVGRRWLWVHPSANHYDGEQLINRRSWTAASWSLIPPTAPDARARDPAGTARLHHLAAQDGPATSTRIPITK